MYSEKNKDLINTWMARGKCAVLYKKLLEIRNGHSGGIKCEEKQLLETLFPQIHLLFTGNYY
jgi:hypothetical protein